MSSPSEIEIEGEDTRLCRVYNARLSYFRGDRRFTRHNPELGIVAAAVRVGVTDLTPQAMMTEQRAESRRSHGLAAVAAFQRDEQSGRVDQGPFQAQIVVEHFEDLRGQRHEALPVAFAEDTHLAVGELQVFLLKR